MCHKHPSYFILSLSVFIVPLQDTPQIHAPEVISKINYKHSDPVSTTNDPSDSAIKLTRKSRFIGK